MAQLNTKIILRNDSTVNWEAAADQILLKGEVGIEFLADGTTKIKIGDGVKTWAELDYYGCEERQTQVYDLVLGENQTHEEAISAATAGQEVAAGDVAVVKELIAENKYIYTAYVHNGTSWIVAGKNIEIDEKQFKFEGGKLSLLGFTEAVAGAQLVIEETEVEGQKVKSLKWVKPTATNEELSTQVTTLENNYTTLENIVNNTETGLVTEVNEINNSLTTINNTLGQKADAANVYNKTEVYTTTEVDNAISVAIAAADHLKRVKVDNVEAIDLTADDADQYIYMVPVGEGDTETNDLYDEYMVLDGKLEKVGSWQVDLSGYATKTELNELSATVDQKVPKEAGKSLVADTEIAKLATVGENAEENFIKSVNETQLAVAEGKLSVTGIDQALVGGLTNVAGTADTLANILGEKVDKHGTDRLMTAEEAKKLEALVIGESGTVEISGSVNASKVQELYDNVVRIVTTEGQYEYDGVMKDMLNIKPGAQVNIIEHISLAGGSPLTVGENKTVDIPLATGANAGLVKSSTAENKIAVGTDGTMEVNSLNVNKLTQSASDLLILNGGNSAGEYPTE